MQKHDVTVRPRFSIVDIARHTHHGERRIHVVTRNDATFCERRSAPQPTRDCVELNGIIRETRTRKRPIADDARTLAHQCVDTTEHRQCHLFAAAAEIQQPIAHAAGGHEIAVLDPQTVQQHIAVGKIEPVTGRRIAHRMVANNTVEGASSP